MPDPDLEIRWGGGNGHPDPYIRGEGRPVSKKNFSVLRASVWSEISGGGSPGSATAYIRNTKQTS